MFDEPEALMSDQGIEEEDELPPLDTDEDDSLGVEPDVENICDLQDFLPCCAIHVWSRMLGTFFSIP